MDCLVVNGGKPLSGSITVGGMKNAALPILFATILVEGRCVIENLPPISDVTTALEILRAMGAKIHMLNKTTMEIDTSVIRCGSAPYELARNMRASYYVLGAELGRFRQASAACPGGCDFGVRPIDQHVKGFESLGAKVSVVSGYVRCDASESRLKAANIYMDVVTVGATINVMLAAVKAQGQTVIENAAKEPHVVDLANFLNACGANIVGAGTDIIKIKGVDTLHGVTYAIIPDMIEAGTYMMAAAATGSRLTVSNVIPKHLESITAKLEEMGVGIEEHDESVTVIPNGRLGRVNVKTLPYPRLPHGYEPADVRAALPGGRDERAHRGRVGRTVQVYRGVDPHGRFDQGGRPHRHRRGRGVAAVRACARRGFARGRRDGHRRADGAGRDGHQRHSPHRARLRVHRGKAAKRGRGYPPRDDGRRRRVRERLLSAFALRRGVLTAALRRRCG